MRRLRMGDSCYCEVRRQHICTNGAVAEVLDLESEDMYKPAKPHKHLLGIVSIQVL